MSLLASALLAARQDKAASEQSEARKIFVGKCRLAQNVFVPINYATKVVLRNHRINLTLYKLDEM